jgi:hypothetical protein
MGCQTQWRTGYSGRTGLIYSECDVVADKLGFSVDAESFHILQTLEREMLKIDADKHKES